MFVLLVVTNMIIITPSLCSDFPGLIGGSPNGGYRKIPHRDKLGLERHSDDPFPAPMSGTCLGGISYKYMSKDVSLEDARFFFPCTNPSLSLRFLPGIFGTRQVILNPFNFLSLDYN